MSDTTRDRAAPPSGASQLMRSLGLLVDGPLRWGAPVPSRRPGVFVIELAEPLERAPIDPAALRRWLEQVPNLRLDGEGPTVDTLGRRLADFWLAGEPIVYVGRSTRAIGSRLAAITATPLGHARPAAGGHWLKTLARPEQLRIWWAETDAHEEYEDGLLAAIADRQPAQVLAGLPQRDAVLPFANLIASDGTPKAHGLSNFLREPDGEGRPQSASPTARGSRSPARPKSPATPRRTAPAGVRQRASAVQPPAPPPTYLSQNGLDQLHAELEQLRTAVRPLVIERVKQARELGDLRENAEYESARKEQSFVEGRIQSLEAMVKAAVVVEADASRESAGVGSTVVVESDGQRLTFVLVGSSEADPAAGRISYASPVGQALLGSGAGQEVDVRLPRGGVRYRVIEVR